MNDKIQRIIENQKIRNRLHEIGIHSGEISKSSNIGPTGERSPASLASYNAIAFASFMNTTKQILVQLELYLELIDFFQYKMELI